MAIDEAIRNVLQQSGLDFPTAAVLKRVPAADGATVRAIRNRLVAGEQLMGKGNLKELSVRALRVTLRPRTLSADFMNGDRVYLSVTEWQTLHLLCHAHVRKVTVTVAELREATSSTTDDAVYKLVHRVRAKVQDRLKILAKRGPGGDGYVVRPGQLHSQKAKSAKAATPTEVAVETSDGPLTIDTLMRFKKVVREFGGVKRVRTILDRLEELIRE